MRAKMCASAAVRRRKKPVFACVALLGIFQERGSRVIFIAYAACADGEPVCGDECIEVRYFAPDSLPPLAFENDAAILAAWRRHWLRRKR